MGMAREDEYLPELIVDDRIELSMEELGERMEAATRETARLNKLYLAKIRQERSRVPDPGWDNFTFEVRFRNNPTTYHYTARRMKTGAIYTTATVDNRFQSWGLFVRWLRDDDKVYVSPLTKLEPTNLIAVVRS